MASWGNAMGLQEAILLPVQGSPNCLQVGGADVVHLVAMVMSFPTSSGPNLCHRGRDSTNWNRLMASCIEFCVRSWSFSAAEGPSI